MSNSHKTSRWRFKTAKLRFAELFRRACLEGPQWVTRNSEEVVIVSASEFEQLTRGVKRQNSLVDFFAESPLAGAGVNLERTPDYGRVEDLEIE